MKSLSNGIAAGLFLALACTSVQAVPINQVDYFTLGGTQIITFDDVAGGAAPGTNYDGILVSGGASFAERFQGQTRTTSSDFDVLSGLPSGPLSLALGATGQNVNVFINAGTQVLSGLGPLGFPDSDAIGEGSFAVLFTTDQSEFGFQLVGGNGGTATVDFFRRDGSSIHSIALSGLANAYYGFQRDGGLKDIAGISVFNNDPAGIALDDLKHDVRSGQPVPEPTSLALLASGLMLLVAGRRRA